DREKLVAKFKTMTPGMADDLEKEIVRLEGQIEMPKSFVIPGANPGSAALDMARAIVRRAERRLVTLQDKGDMNNEAILQYVNRLADLLFVLARYEEA
ncbi:MAG: ATP:cob(I)alamin adenosyltransferase, partial [Pseudomonadota bacterium]